MYTKFIPTRSTWIHLRFIFSLYLLPVYLFALSQAGSINVLRLIGSFLILHFLIYPASNGYNSYYDKDEGSIGGVETPPKVDISLLSTSWIMEILGISLGLILFPPFGFGVILFGILSKVYSHPKTRVKRMAFISFLLVFIFQGGFIYGLTRLTVSVDSTPFLWDDKFLLGALFASFMVGAMYVLTQIYQHEEDFSRGDFTLSLRLGYRGTFFFSAGNFIGAALSLYRLGQLNHQAYLWPAFLVFTVPVMLYFSIWFADVWVNPIKADFTHTMRMNLISFVCLSLFFSFLWWQHQAK